MKTSEFIREVEKLEFVGAVVEKVHGIFGSFEKRLIVRDKTESILATVSIENELMIATRFSSFAFLTMDQRWQLFILLTEYAATPIAERRDKTIEEKAKEYIQEYAADNLSFESARDFLECCHLYFNDEDKDRKYLIDAHLSNYSQERLKECSEIYDWYHENSNNFIKLWLEMSEDE